MKQRIAFKDYYPNPIGDDWFVAPAAVANSGLSASSPSVSVSGGEYFLSPGRMMLACGRLSPGGWVNRISVDATLTAIGGIVRIVLPYNETPTASGSISDEEVPISVSGNRAEFIEVEAGRRADGDVEISIYLTSAPLSLTRSLVGYSLIDADATARATFSVECGPRHIRAWWHLQKPSDLGVRFTRTDPHVTALSTEIDPLAWGIAVFDAKVYGFELDDDSVDDADDAGDKWTMEADADTPDADLAAWSDTSSAALAHYAVISHTSRRRAQTILAASGSGATGNIADHLFHRLDPTQTLVLAPIDEDTDLRLATVAEDIAGPSSDTASFQITEDPAGVDGGIGSARSNMDGGGELNVDVGIVRPDSTVQYSQQDLVSDTGGQEVYQQVASRQRREWGLKCAIAPSQIRRLERAIAAAGGARSVWFMPPQSGRPAAAMVGGAQHSTEAAKQVNVSMDMVEA